MNGDTPVLVPDKPTVRSGTSVSGAFWRLGALAAIVFLAGLIIVLNFLPDQLGIVRSLSRPDSLVPLLAPGFEAHVPGLTVWLGLGIVLNAFHLAYGEWRPWTRWFEWGANIVGIGVLLSIVRGGPIVALDQAWLARQAYSAAESAKVERLAHWGDILAHVVAGAVALGLAIAVVTGLIRNLRDSGVIERA